MAEVRFDTVEKVYPGGVHAVRDLTLDVADGELLVLVGPSGCGKSTVLRLVAGLERLTSGSIRIGDRVVNDVAPKDRDIAMVFQSYALYPHMTVAKNLGFGLKMRKVPKVEVERRVRAVADQLGLAEMLDRRPGSLSGGQQQRVAVGRAIVREPRCFLFDEPLSNLDAALRVQMRAELKTLVQRLGTTTIFVTHDQEEAMTLGDRIVVLCDGAVQQVGRPLEVYRRPANAFVAGFVGSPPMNLLPGRIVQREGVAWFEGGGDVTLAVATNGSVSSKDEVVLGLRPESMHPGGGGDSGLAMDVALCEIVGDRMDLHGTTPGGAPIVARVPASDEWTAGRRVTLRVEPSDVHLFEPGTFGKRL